MPSDLSLPQTQTDQRLLRSIAEELKTPLLRIARQAELARLKGDAASLASIEATADAALSLLDSYLISTQLCNGQQALQLEPVSVSATMYDVSQYLARLARLHNCELELKASSSCGLVMAHPLGLRAALMGLGYSFIHALEVTRKKQKITFVARRTKQGVHTGVYSSVPSLGSDIFKQAKQLYGVARQPIPDLTYANGAGIFVADSLFDVMASQLKVARHRKTTGLAALLLPSQQLALL